MLPIGNIVDQALFAVTARHPLSFGSYMVTAICLIMHIWNTRFCHVAAIPITAYVLSNGQKGLAEGAPTRIHIQVLSGIHSYLHSQVHSGIQTSAHTLIHSEIQSGVHSLTLTGVHSGAIIEVHSSAHTRVHSRVASGVPSRVHYGAACRAHTRVHASVHSAVHSFIHFPVLCAQRSREGCRWLPATASVAPACIRSGSRTAQPTRNRSDSDCAQYSAGALLGNVLGFPRTTALLRHSVPLSSSERPVHMPTETEWRISDPGHSRAT